MSAPASSPPNIDRMPATTGEQSQTPANKMVLSQEPDNLGADPEQAPEPASVLRIASHTGDSVAKMPSWRKWVILFVVCWMGMPVTFSSTSIMTVNPEIAETFGTEPTAISTANAAVFVSMALSTLIWLPVTTIIGRRSTYLVTTATFTLCSVGCGLSKNIATFTAMWVIMGSTGPFFLVAGQTILSDIFEPAVRGSAVGIFLGSTVSAQSITPMIGSIIATFSSWRVIFGVQGGMAFLGMALAFFFVPTSSQLSNVTTPETLEKMSVKEVLRAFNPVNVFKLWKYPSILLSNITCGLLAVNQYVLVSSVRHVINPLFGLTAPMYSGLFYLAPGVGFLLGSIVGGHLSDRTVIRYRKRRDGIRLAEDRLNSSLYWFFIVLPAGTLLYGWSVDREVGGMGLPISASFIQGFGLMAAFNGLNTYAAEVHPQYKAAVISGKYMVQYTFGAGAVGSTVPLIDTIGTGWVFTIASATVVLGGICVIVITRCLVRDSSSQPRSHLFEKERLELLLHRRNLGN